MLIQNIIQCLRASMGTQSVFGAAEFYHAVENAGYTESPSYFVIPQTEAGVGTDEDNVFTINQLVRVAVMVDLTKQDARAERAFFDATTERENVFKALLGKPVEECGRPAEFVNGALLSSDGRRLFYGYTLNFPVEVDPTNYAAPISGHPAKITLKHGAPCP